MNILNSTSYQKIIPTVKKFLGIKDISLWRKRWNKRIGKIIYRKKYNADDLIGKMKELGLKKGSVVCIHASMMQFYNYTGTASELIDKILQELGEEGTLMMPAFPILPDENRELYVFNPQKDKTGAGYLAETFRKYPNVIRSNNVRHSVCAWGKHAQYLIQDHTNGHNCWDKKSPWYRLCELNGLVFNLGMPHSYIGTFHHCVESILQYEHPYWGQFFNNEQAYRYIDEHNTIIEYKATESDIFRKTKESQVTRYFTNKDWAISRISNLEIKVFYSKHALETMLNLGRKGISVYRIPTTTIHKF